MRRAFDTNSRPILDIHWQNFKVGPAPDDERRLAITVPGKGLLRSLPHPLPSQLIFREGPMRLGRVKETGIGIHRYAKAETASRRRLHARASSSPCRLVWAQRGGRLPIALAEAWHLTNIKTEEGKMLYFAEGGTRKRLIKVAEAIFRHLMTRQRQPFFPPFVIVVLQLSARVHCYTLAKDNC